MDKVFALMRKGEKNPRRIYTRRPNIMASMSYIFGGRFKTGSKPNNKSLDNYQIITYDLVESRRQSIEDFCLNRRYAYAAFYMGEVYAIVAGSDEEFKSRLTEDVFSRTAQVIDTDLAALVFSKTTING